MKTRILTLLTLAAVVSCQEALIERRADGRLTLDLENSPVVEVVTKAEEVSTDDFNVYVKSEEVAHAALEGLLLILKLFVSPTSIDMFETAKPLPNSLTVHVELVP